MRFFLGICAMLLCIPSASTLAVNLTTIFHSLIQSHDTSIPSANWYPTCINGAQHPHWTGLLHSTACTNALIKLKSITQPFGDKTYIFFSNEYVKDPPDGSWSLPRGLSYGEHPAGIPSFSTWRIP